MLYVGLDIHLKQISVCVLDENGKVLRRERVPDVSALVKLLTSLGQPLSVCYEASCGYGRWHEILSRIAARVVVAHPGHLRLIFRSKRKHDALDAEKLAKTAGPRRRAGGARPAGEGPGLAGTDLVPAEAGSQADARQERHPRPVAIAGDRHVPRRPGLWTHKGIAWLKRLEIEQPALAIKRDMLLVEEIATFDRQIARVEKELARFARKSPAVTSAAHDSRRRPADGRGGVPPSSTTRSGSPAANRSARTSAWSRPRTNRETRTGWGTSPARVHRSCGTI